MKTRHILSLIFLSLTFASYAQPLPMDSAVRHGKLENGLTYYICPTENHSGQAHYYIVQRVGSILEEEHQRGLAHFLEHMAFNGTKHFPGKQLIGYLESNGVQFGTDINAYTAFDETVYSLSRVPTHRMGLVDSCLLILRDWSNDITLTAQEIDAERKVIHEEWRTKRNARDRIYEQTLPKLFPDSNRYAYRMPIGLMEVVDNFPHEALRDYYRQWYRPDLQAVIIAGDVDANYVESQIRKLWSDVSCPTDASERIYYTVPDNSVPIVAVGTDPELTSGMLRISFKYDPLTAEESESVHGRRDEYLRSMIISMLTARIADMQHTDNSAQQFGISFFDGDYSIAQTKKAFSVKANFRDDDWAPAMLAIVRELKQAMQYGFTSEEYERAKLQLTPWIEAMERGTYNLSASMMAERCKAHFLRYLPLLSMADEANLYRHLLGSVTLDDINERLGQLLYTQGGIAILLQGQTHSDHHWPTEAEVMDIYGKGWMQEVNPYKIPSAEPTPKLMQERPVAGSIVKEKQNKQYATRELMLSNGAHVILKPIEGSSTLRIKAISHGGTSLLPDNEYYNIAAINALPSMGGLGQLSNRQLGLALEGSSASYQTNVGTLIETFTGGCLPADTEQMLQLLHLRFTTVRQDSAAFIRWQQNRRNSVSQQIANPMAIFSDTLQSTLYEPHPRHRKVSLALADSVDYDHTCTLFRERFANAADFTFIFVGAMDVDSLRPLICQYIASLPANPKVKERANLAALPRLRKGKHVTHLHIPEGGPATTVIYNIQAPARYTARSNAACALLSEVMSTLCTETLREKEGGTYNVSVNVRISRQPVEELALMFNFNTNPEQAQRLLDKALGLLAQVAKEGPPTVALDNARKYLLKRHADYQATPAFWMDALTDRVRYNNADILTNEATLQQVTAKEVQRLARKLSRSGNTAEVILNGL